MQVVNLPLGWAGVVLLSTESQSVWPSPQPQCIQFTETSSRFYRTVEELTAWQCSSYSRYDPRMKCLWHRGRTPTH